MFPFTNIHLYPLLIKTSYTYLPSARSLVAVDPKDISNLPPIALVIPTVNAFVMPKVAPIDTLFDIAAEPL